MFDYLENLRAKPGHVRQRIALGAAGGVTLVVLVGWMVVLATSHTFDLTPPTFANAEEANTLHNAVTQTKTSFSSLLGAAAASQSTGSGITVVTQATTSGTASAPTAIPF